MPAETTFADDREGIVRIAPYEYVHILNLNTHVTRLLLGPKSYVCLQDERLVLGPEKVISLPVMKYCVVENPVVTDEDGKPVFDVFGQVKISLGDKEYRFHRDPFPLYPGEKLCGSIDSLPVVPINRALRLKALVNFVDNANNSRVAGEEWMFKGPAVYYPQKEVEVLCSVKASIIEINTALCLMATKDCVDQEGNQRVYGEKWLVRKPGAYLPGAYEEVVETRKAFTLTESVALHVKSLETHTDEFGNRRRYGEEWLITKKDTDSHICSVFEEVVRIVYITVLNAHQYCVILNPVDENGVPQLGKRTLVRGEKCFFLRPGEELENGVQDTFILQSNEGIILRAMQRFEDQIPGLTGDEPSSKVRKPGDQWMLRGPMEYVPPVEAQVVRRQQVIPLDKNEGIYVRNTITGQIRAVIGQAYMLTQDEELWSKKLPNEVINMLAERVDPVGDRAHHWGPNIGVGFHRFLDLTRVVTYRLPHNAAAQIYDYKDKKARVEFGPALVMLGPDEQFTRLSLSGGKPKQPDVIKSLCLLLGPDFFTDIVVVETADHACLSLQVSYNWHFEVPNPCSQEDAAKLFAVPDFVGDACKTIASRIRGAVASVPFDDFHKNSARIVRASVFGIDENDKVRDVFVFPQNNLHITSIDIQCVEPLDTVARSSLEKSVQLAIEIRSKSQEATAKHEADRLEQEALGALQRQKIADEAAAEKARRALIEAQVELAAVENAGQAKAKAQGRAEAARIEGESEIESAKMRAEAAKITTDGEVDCKTKLDEAELQYLTEKNEVAVKYHTEAADIEVGRFQAMVQAIGPDTLASIATAGSDQAQKLLGCLGLQSSLITNGTKPVNLLSTAHGLIGQLSRGQAAGDLRLLDEARETKDTKTMKKWFRRQLKNAKKDRRKKFTSSSSSSLSSTSSSEAEIPEELEEWIKGLEVELEKNEQHLPRNSSPPLS
ncbi:unnamed protein product [Calicophoron daubneyi]|uniref:Major vault protein n=1 Tax=Calicophoron daubneyi TaxID=300641 RepID=A0AAV2TBH0_CALDB